MSDTEQTEHIKTIEVSFQIISTQKSTGEQTVIHSNSEHGTGRQCRGHLVLESIQCYISTARMEQVYNIKKEKER